MTNEFNLGELVDIPSASITEEIADKYNGTKVKIRTVYPGEKKTSWDSSKTPAVKLPDGQFVMAPVVFVETEAFGSDSLGQPLVVKESLPIKLKGGKKGFSEHPKSKARKFLKMLKINKVDEAIGREVLIIKNSYGDPANLRYALVISLP